MRFLTGSNGVKAMIGAAGRCFEMSCAVVPRSLKATITPAAIALAADAAAVQIASGKACLLYTSDAADARTRVSIGGCPIPKKKTTQKTNYNM